MNAFSVYWRTYGGLKELLWSPYFFGAANFWIWCKPIWGDFISNFIWHDWGISLIGSVLSFSLGSLAIFLAFSNEAFLKVIRNNGDSASFFMTVVTAFFHFILVQFVALSAMVMLIAYPNIYMSSLGFFLLCYAVACGIAAAAALVDTADLLNKMGVLDDDAGDGSV